MAPSPPRGDGGDKDFTSLASPPQGANAVMQRPQRHPPLPRSVTARRRCQKGSECRPCPSQRWRRRLRGGGICPPAAGGGRKRGRAGSRHAAGGRAALAAAAGAGGAGTAQRGPGHRRRFGSHRLPVPPPLLLQLRGVLPQRRATPQRHRYGGGWGGGDTTPGRPGLPGPAPELGR